MTWQKGGRDLKKQKLTYRFHDPNPEGMVADYILELFMEVDEERVEQAMKQEALETEVQQEDEGMGGLTM